MQGHGGPGSLACSGANDRSWRWRYIKAIDQYDGSKLGLPEEEPGAGLNCMDNKWTPSVFYSLSCDIMPFDAVYHYPYQYNIGTSYTVGGLYGGVAILGNTRIGYDYYNKILESKYAGYIKDYNTLGKAHCLAKVASNLSGYSCAAHNIFGDPETIIWTHKPAEMPLNVYPNGNMITLTGPDLIGCNVSIWTGSECISNGLATTSTKRINGTNQSTLVISAWKPGYLPYIALLGQGVQLTGEEGLYIVKDAVLLADRVSKVPSVIGAGGHLKIKALNTIRLDEETEVAKDARVDLICMNQVTLESAKVSKGGTLVIAAEEVCLEPGFVVEQGGLLTVDRYTNY